jgi:hypothetical protein
MQTEPSDDLIISPEMMETGLAAMVRADRPVSNEEAQRILDAYEAVMSSRDK